MLDVYSVGDKCIAQWRAPAGIVALDIDARDVRFRLPWQRKVMVAEVRAMANGLAASWGLGRYWMYYTGSPGLHVIFERPAERWAMVLDAANLHRGWRECGGHHSICLEDRFCALRVGYKNGRGIWDIFPVENNPTEDIPDHVAEHDRLLSLRIPVKIESLPDVCCPVTGQKCRPIVSGPKKGQCVGCPERKRLCPFKDVWPERECSVCAGGCPGKGK